MEKEWRKGWRTKNDERIRGKRGAEGDVQINRRNYDLRWIYHIGILIIIFTGVGSIYLDIYALYKHRVYTDLLSKVDK